MGSSIGSTQIAAAAAVAAAAVAARLHAVVWQIRGYGGDRRMLRTAVRVLPDFLRLLA